MEQGLVKAQMIEVVAPLGAKGKRESFPSGKGVPRILGLWKCSKRE